METVLNLGEIETVRPDALFSADYPKEDVLKRIEDKRVRRVNLDKAITLGKSAKIRTRLVFRTTEGYKNIACIVHAQNEKGITIEGDHFIPMHVIYTVDMLS